MPKQLDDDLSYTAWRWLGARSPWLSYFVAYPQVYFLRVGDDVHIRWDNRALRIDGIQPWSAATSPPA